MTASDYRHHVSKLVNIDGRFYDLKVSPAGDKLTLTPSTVPLGKRDQPQRRLSAVVYGDRGFLKIRGEQGEAVPWYPQASGSCFLITHDGKQPPKPRKRMPGASRRRRQRSRQRQTSTWARRRFAPGFRRRERRPDRAARRRSYGRRRPPHCKAITVARGDGRISVRPALQAVVTVSWLQRPLGDRQRQAGPKKRPRVQMSCRWSVRPARSAPT